MGFSSSERVVIERLGWMDRGLRGSGWGMGMRETFFCVYPSYGLLGPCHDSYDCEALSAELVLLVITSSTSLL